MREPLILEHRIPQNLPFKFNVITTLHPVNSSSLLQMFRTDEGSHTPMKECLLLPEVTDIDLNLLVLMVLDGEVKPL